MILRYKKKDDGITKFKSIIEDEWFPKPGDVETGRPAAFTNVPSKHDTPAIDVSTVAECHKMSIVTGIPPCVNRDNASIEIMAIFASKDHELVTRIDFKSTGTVVIVCKDWAACKHISDTYQKSKVKGHEVVFSMFTEVDPAN